MQYWGKNVMKGYWGRDDATAAALEGGWYRTGDIAVRDADGYFTIKDRIKDMYISGGFNVYPAEVEQALMRMDGVDDVAVIGVPDERWIEAITAVVVLKDGAQVTEEQVIAHVKENLAGFKVLSRST